ncbi:Anaphase-promoting complex subunit 7 [Mortierella claussenii]|nr:Anaphase-promoting complex subunit 7 [Mortierella claussenii]
MIPSDSLEKRWMTIYLLGTDNFLRMKHAGEKSILIAEAALSEFCKLNEKYPDNIDLKLRMALCLKRLGKAVRASFVYSQVRKLDSCVLKDMYHYGVCLRQLSSAAYLNKLASELLRCNDRHADTWCVQALYWDMKKNKEKALQMIARALQINPEHCGALQLRGQVYMDTSPTEALKAFREANRIERDIVTLEGLVNAYILLGRQLEAVGIAKEALSLMPDNPQAMALYGMATYHAGEQGTDIATELLLKALDKDPACVQAAICLVMIYENQERYNDALELLDQQIDYQPPDTVYVRKAEIYTTMEDWEQALSSYQKALSANLNNTRAKEGLAHVEKILSGGDEEDDEEAEETDNNDDRENEDIDTDPDQHQLNDHMGGNLDEDDVLTGEEDQGEEYEDDYSYRQQEQHHQPHHSTHQHVHQAPQPQQLEESSLYQSRGFGQTRHQQTPVMTRLIRAGVAFEQGPPPLQHPRLNQNQPQQQFLSQLQQQPHQQQHRSAGSNSVPGFGMRYPHTPSRPPVGSGASSRTPLPLPTSRLFTSQRERDYEEAADGGEDMEG